MEYLKNISSLTLEINKCIGCGFCIEVCPREVLMLHEGQVDINSLDKCIECGACMMNCPTEALSVDNGVGCALAMYEEYFQKIKSKFKK